MTSTPPAKIPYRRIAVEEAWMPPEIANAYFDIVKHRGVDDPGFYARSWFTGQSERAKAMLAQIQDVGEGRIAEMDRLGIDAQLLSLTQPGVQLFDREMANALARHSNDLLAQAIAKHPTRFDGLAAVAPQGPAEGARERVFGLTPG